jgi:TonB-dependent receptor
MQTKLKILAKTTLLVFLATGWMPLVAQVTPASTSPDDIKKDDKAVKLDTFVVNGFRASLASAAEIKQSNLQLVDSIVASDIDKLPDINVSYALSRIPGIQVAHTFAGLGGNGGVTIRGLTQIANTIDGREVITPGGISGGGVGAGLRSFDYSQIPSALIAGIDVYKTSAANQLDGGLGGLIDVRMRKPFDFAEGFEAGGTLGVTYASLRDRSGLNYTVFGNATRKTDHGKIGVLVSVSDNITPWREDSIGVGNPTPNATVTSGVPTALTATSYANSSSYGKFNTSGFNAVFEWQPTEHLQLYAGVNHNKWTNTQDQVQLSVATPISSSVPGSGVMFAGSDTATRAATFTNVTGTAFGVIRDLKDSLQIYSFGGKFTSGDLTVKFDANHNTSDYRFYNNGVYASVAIPSITTDLAGKIPSVTVAGASLEDPSIYRLVQVYNRLFPSNTKATAAKVDAEYNIKGGFFSKILGGVRYSSTESDNGTTGLFLGSYNLPATGNLISQYPGLWENSPIQNLFSGSTQPQLQQYLVGNPSTLRDTAALLKAYGAPSTVTPENDAKINPLSLYKITETTSAVYLMPQFTGKIGAFLFDGNVGLRFVQTKEDLNGNQTTNPGTTSQGIGPINIKTDYTDLLPSFNYRLKLTDKLYLRLAASKTITRPNFGSLSPSLTLNANPIDPNLNSGSQGNPDLKPIRSTNIDLSLEYYTSKSNLIYAAVFHKNVKGFITGVSTPKTYDGLTYQISTSENLTPATIKGAEIGFQQFFNFLPAPFDGLGFQANFTYVESSTPTTVSGVTGPVDVSLTNLSPKSYNAVLMYEKGPFSARLAYNWRDKYVTGVSYFVNAGLLTQEVKAYGDLDASLNYEVTKNITIAVQGVNLTDSIRYQYWGSPQHPSNIYDDGASIMGSVTLRF